MALFPSGGPPSRAQGVLGSLQGPRYLAEFRSPCWLSFGFGLVSCLWLDFGWLDFGFGLIWGFDFGFGLIWIWLDLVGHGLISDGFGFDFGSISGRS